jgi:hypothetical protein
LGITSYVYTVIAEQNGTIVTINNGTPFTLNAGQSQIFENASSADGEKSFLLPMILILYGREQNGLGELVQFGTYVWKARYRLADDIERVHVKERTGHINVIR